MLLVAYWILLFVFWFYILKFVKLRKYSLAGSATALWAIAYFSQSFLGIAGGLYFLSFEAVLNFFLIIHYQTTIRKAALKPIDMGVD